MKKFEMVQVEICSRHGLGTHETKKIRLRKYGYFYLTMSKRTYDKYAKLLCRSGADCLCQSRKSDFCIVVRDYSGSVVRFF